MKININNSDIQLIDDYNLIKNTTKITNSVGETKRYVAYNCSFPYIFIEMFNHPKHIFYYEKNNNFYITNKEPSKYYNFKKITLHSRKNSKQKTSKENDDKKWAKLITVPKTLMGNVGNYKKLNYVLHCNKKDYVNGRYGLLQVYLS